MEMMLFVMFEAVCKNAVCGEITYTDEFYVTTLGEKVPLHRECYECGDDSLGEWKLSDQPPPALWG